MTELIEKDCQQRETKFRVRFFSKDIVIFRKFSSFESILLESYSVNFESKTISELRTAFEWFSSRSFYEIWFFSSLVDRNFWSKLLGLKIFRVNACLIWFLRLPVSRYFEIIKSVNFRMFVKSIKISTLSFPQSKRLLPYWTDSSMRLMLTKRIDAIRSDTPGTNAWANQKLFRKIWTSSNLNSRITYSTA